VGQEGPKELVFG
jgi:hypothetical protein